jgi:phytoene dehydrogenase-like protein
LRKINIAVVGSGIGGSLISALNHDKDLVLFEKDSNLGGCASTFIHKDSYFNTGATSLIGLEPNTPLQNIFDEINFKPNAIKSDIALRVIQRDKIIDRSGDFESFLESVNQYYPHKNNRIFWTKIKELDEKFWKIKNIYFAKYSLRGLTNSAKFISQMGLTFNISLLENAQSYINRTLNGITNEYLDFINAQLLITLQEDASNLSLLAMALGLSYPFHDVYYANGGMGSVIEDIVKNVEVHKNEAIEHIKIKNDKFIVSTSKESYEASRVILNSTIYDSAKLFDDKNIKKYYNNFKLNDKSAFVLYIKLNISNKFLHHYQIILNDFLPMCISKSFFVSFSDINDQTLSGDGLSITISTHTKAMFWSNLSKIEYKEKKLKLQEFITNEFLSYFKEIKRENIVQIFSATSKTFNRYISRTNCGGEAISLKNALKFPTCNTPFDSLYNVGDTVFAGQGWNGVAMGAIVLNKELNGQS